MDFIRLSILIFIVLYLFMIPIFFRLRDKEDHSLSVAMSLFVMAALALIPTAVLVAIIMIGYLFMDIVSITPFIQFSSHWDTVVYVIALLIILSVGELVIIPIAKSLLTLVLRHPLSKWIGDLVTIVINTLLISIISELLPGVTIQGIEVALGMALVYQCMEWMVDIRTAKQSAKSK
ncbi:hypothetical protein [Paenibacillus wenxiniae]|uniref:Uncharacterized protein n=1 Tax=Paenibacillus wenxiniae TaxID=1636843 RepID=A0ABW4RPU2_9BACL